MHKGINKLYEFGEFRFSAENKTLWRGEELISLSPKALDVLCLLLEYEGKLVSKQKILNTVWADTFVEEGVLTQNIYTLRQALGKDGDGNQFIENMARRGYRFAAPLKISRVADDKASDENQKVGSVFNGVSANFRIDPFENTFDPIPAAHKTNEVIDSQEKENGFPTSTAPEDAVPNSALRYAVWSGFAALILSALGFGIYQFLISSKETIEPETAPIELVRLQRLTDTGDVVFPTISPNGRLLAYVRHQETHQGVWVKQIDSDSSVQTLPPSRKGYSSLKFSPDGNYLFFREKEKGGSIYQTPAIGGARKKVADNVWSEFSFSPDGQTLAFVRHNTDRKAHLIILAKADGSGERELSFRKSPEYYTGAIGWSPDGTKLIVSAILPRNPLITLLLIDIADGQQTEWKIGSWRMVSNILWMPDGKNLILSGRDINEPTSQIWVVSYPDGQVHRLTNDLEAYFRLSLSADGQKLIARQQKIVLHLWLLQDYDVNNARQITFGNRNFDGYGGLAWTPDDKIIFTSPLDYTTNLYSINSDGGNKIQLTENAGRDNTYPTVSPDGRYIVFSSNRTGTTQIWRMDNAGHNQKQLTFSKDQKQRAQSPVLSPDGREVFFIKSGIDPPSIWKVSIEGGEPVPVSDLKDVQTGGFLSISPDGKWLAYYQIMERSDDNEDESTMKIGIFPVSGDAEPKQFDLPVRRPIIQWSGDTTFDYSAGTFNSSSLWRQSISGEKPQKLLELPDRIFNFARSQDGQDLVVSRGKLQGDAILITNLP